MKKKLKDELDSRDTIQHYICHSCNKRYSAFDALQLVSYTDDYFHCESCNGELVAVRDKLASEEMRGGDDNARKFRSDLLKDMQDRIDEQLKPLLAQLDRVKNLPAPEFGTLQSWERAHIGAFANGCPGAADSYGTSTLRINPVPLKFDIIPGDGGDGSSKNDTGQKIVPPWMVRVGMNLTKEQRGDIPLKQDEISETKDDNKQKSQDEKTIEDEYIKAYYEAWRKQEEEDAKRRMQHEGETFTSHSQSKRQVGMKYKRENEDEGTEEEADLAAGNAGEANKLEPQESGDDADDGFEWVEG